MIHVRIHFNGHPVSEPAPILQCASLYPYHIGQVRICFRVHSHDFVEQLFVSIHYTSRGLTTNVQDSVCAVLFSDSIRSTVTCQCISTSLYLNTQTTWSTPRCSRLVLFREPSHAQANHTLNMIARTSLYQHCCLERRAGRECRCSAELSASDTEGSARGAAR